MAPITSRKGKGLGLSPRSGDEDSPDEYRKGVKKAAVAAGVATATDKKTGATQKKTTTKKPATPIKKTTGAIKKAPRRKSNAAKIEAPDREPLEESDLGSEDEVDDDDPAVLKGDHWTHRPEPKNEIKAHLHGVEPEMSDPISPALEMGTAKQPVGSNFMSPYDPLYRAHYLDGFHRTTIANYNNRRHWPVMPGKVKAGWIWSIVAKEQAVLRMQRREAARKAARASKVTKTEAKDKSKTKANGKRK